MHAVSKSIFIALCEDGATDRTGDVREAFPSGDGGGLYSVHYSIDITFHTRDNTQICMTNCATISSSDLQH